MVKLIILKKKGGKGGEKGTKGPGVWRPVPEKQVGGGGGGRQGQKAKPPGWAWVERTGEQTVEIQVTA
mgnify:CR=1 FL=1